MKQNMDENLIVSAEGVTCEECLSHVTEYYLMGDTLATDDTRSNGKQSEDYSESKELCIECAFELFESSGGQWQCGIIR